MHFVNGTHVAESVRALCDTGAQANLISAGLAHRSGFRIKKCSIGIVGAGEQRIPIHEKIVVSIARVSGEAVLHDVPFYVAGFMDSVILPSKVFPEPHQLPAAMQNDLADEDFFRPDKVEAVLSAATLARIWRNGFIPGGSGAAAQNTALGWIVFGLEPPIIDMAKVMLCNSCENTLPDLVKRLIDFEDLEPSDSRTLEQELCEQNFIQTHEYDAQGQCYTVRIPLRDDWKKIGSTREASLRRFMQLENRLLKDLELREQYHKFMADYLQRGFMVPADSPTAEEKCVHIPHHSVAKKFRVVFDASCTSTTGVSLNQIQLIGERLQEELAAILIRFRGHRFAVTTDIKKMYNCVRIGPEQWNLQRIFWRFSPDEPLNEYCLTVVTFGMASAPHCAVRAMLQCARDHPSVSPDAARAIERDFYMDDGLLGASTADKAKELCNGVQEILLKGGFVLDKWCSNAPRIIDQTEVSEEEHTLFEDRETTVLGIKWLPTTDEIAFKVCSAALSQHRATKRDILSSISKLFDPIGLLGPITICGRMLMQQVWSERTGWDQQVPIGIERKWRDLMDQLQQLEVLRIPRWTEIDCNEEITLHGFADASERAYGAVVYAVIGRDGLRRTRLLSSKARVAPLKKMTIPRLELCAAVLLAKLVVRPKCLSFGKSTAGSLV